MKIKITITNIMMMCEILFFWFVCVCKRLSRKKSPFYHHHHLTFIIDLFVTKFRRRKNSHFPFPSKINRGNVVKVSVLIVNCELQWFFFILVQPHTQFNSLNWIIFRWQIKMEKNSKLEVRKNGKHYLYTKW